MLVQCKGDDSYCGGGEAAGRVWSDQYLTSLREFEDSIFEEHQEEVS